MNQAIPRPLRRLAAAWGLQIGYYDIQRVWREPSQEAILATLKALGSGLEGIGDVPNALKAKQEALWGRPLEPGIPCLENEPVRIRIRLPKCLPKGSLVFEVQEETGASRKIELSYEALRPLSAEQTPDAPPLYAITLPLRLSAGYHTLKLELGDQEYTAHLFAAQRGRLSTRRGESSGCFSRCTRSIPKEHGRG